MPAVVQGLAEDFSDIMSLQFSQYYSEVGVLILILEAMQPRLDLLRNFPRLMGYSMRMPSFEPRSAQQ